MPLSFGLALQLENTAFLQVQTINQTEEHCIGPYIKQNIAAVNNTASVPANHAKLTRLQSLPLQCSVLQKSVPFFFLI